jgi:hypothetical protein
VTPILLPEASTHVVEYDGRIVRRAFWLYVLVATTPKDTELLYVGMTGDSSSFNAQSAYRRLGQHLDPAAHSTTNQPRKQLEKLGIAVEECRFRFVTHGPLLPETETKDAESHYPLRNLIQAMERALAEDLTEAGYEVMNKVTWKAILDQDLYAPVRAAFAEQFPCLAP